jgi:hypothetical protein
MKQFVAKDLRNLQQQHKSLQTRKNEPVCSNQLVLIDDSSYRLNFDLGKKNKIHHHSYKEHVIISKIAKFGCEML